MVSREAQPPAEDANTASIPRAPDSAASLSVSAPGSEAAKPTSHPSETDSRSALLNGAGEERSYTSSQELWNLLVLGLNFSVYFAFRSGSLIVLPNTSKLLLTGVLQPGPEPAKRSPFYQLPMALWFLCDVAVAYPNGTFQQRYGRRAGLLLGGFAALGGCLVAFLSLIFIKDGLTAYVMLCVSIAIMSVVGMSEFVKYAAAEACAPGTNRGKVVSRVIGGGAILSAFGPFSSSFASGLDPEDPIHGYAFFYLILGGFMTVSIMFVSTLRLPPVALGGQAATTDPLCTILRRTDVWTAILAQLSVQFTMVTPMSATPIAMELELGIKPTNYLISSCIVTHIVCMFFPGFFTGNIVKKVGTLPVILAGLLLQTGCLLVFLLGGYTRITFFVGLILLGVGWNFAFVAGTLLLLDSHTERERSKVTSCNETLRFLANGVGALLSTSFHFESLSYLCLGFLVPTTVLVIWLFVRQCNRQRSARAVQQQGA